jgi:hypothetical protein
MNKLNSNSSHEAEVDSNSKDQNILSSSNNAKPMLAAERASPMNLCFIINPENAKESMGIKSSDVRNGWVYKDYLTNPGIPKRLFVRQ